MLSALQGIKGSDDDDDDVGRATSPECGMYECSVIHCECILLVTVSVVLTVV
jgi:hypothetical protein